MSEIPELPRAARPFVEFPTLLRAHGFAVAPEQTQAFITAVGLLGPKDMSDIRRSAHATLAPPYERQEEFDTLFGAFFEGRLIAADIVGESEEEDTRVQDERDGTFEPLTTDDEQESGQQASLTEALIQREFEPRSESEVLAHFARHAPSRLPLRKVRRRARASKGDRFALSVGIR